MRQTGYEGDGRLEAAFDSAGPGAAAGAKQPTALPTLTPTLTAAAPPRQRASGLRHWAQQFDRLFLLHTSDRFTALEGLRGAACLLVFGLHAFYWQAGNPFPGSPHSLGGRIYHFFMGGPTGVDIFFALSGFLIAWTTSRATVSADAPRFNATSFIERRFARLMPVHLIVLALYYFAFAGRPWALWMIPLGAAVVLTRHLTHRTPRAARLARRGLSVLWRAVAVVWLAAAVLLFFPAVRRLPPADFLFNALCLAYFTDDVPVHNPVTWSLSVEYLFYFAFAAFVVVTRRLSGRWRIAAAVALYAGMILSRNSLTAALAPFGLHPVRAERFSAFFAGVGVAALHGDTRLWAQLSRALVPISAVATAVLFLLIYLMADRNGGAWYLTFDAVVACVLAGLLLPRSLPRTLLDNRLFRFFGAISYSFYLIHGQMIFLFDQWVPVETRTLPLALAIAASLAMSVIAGAVLYALFERPYLAAQLARKAARTTPPVAEAPAAPVPAPARGGQ